MWAGQGQTKGRMWPRGCTMPRSEIEDNLSSIDVKYLKRSRLMTMKATSQISPFLALCVCVCILLFMNPISHHKEMRALLEALLSF